MPLDASERERVKAHLGYPAVNSAASLQFGIPRPIETMFLVESAMTQLQEVGIDRVRRILKIMDDIDDKLIDAQDRLAAEKLDSLTLRKDETDALETEYQRWGFRLADQIGCPVYYLSRRYQSAMGCVAGSIPVRG
jgi:hypothetical protein